MNTTEYNGYQVELTRHLEPDTLKNLWSELESQNTRLSFFQSWPWVDTWLSEYRPEAVLVTARYRQSVVAAGILGDCHQRRHYLLSAHQLRLFQTGKPDEDQVWVEFNGFLCHPDHQKSATIACINALLSRQSPYDEIVISMIRESDANALLDAFPHRHISLRTPGYHVDLQSLADNRQGYLASLSRNTRYQINRSIRKYQSDYGDLQLTFAKSAEQAIQFFDQAADFHIERWQDSGFLNPKFTHFHRAFIRRAYDHNMIDLVKITAGKHLIAILYNIIHNGNVYFYLQGVQSETDGKLKPGITAHTMLIEHYMDKGMKSYDFMGGYSQYKKQLSDSMDNYLIINIQKPLYRFRIENMLRKIKHSLL
jgi:hypothetical protein